MDQCETSGDATFMLPCSHSHPSLPFPTIWSKKNQTWHVGRVTPGTGWASGMDKALASPPSWSPFDFSTQMWSFQSLCPVSFPETTSFSKKDSGPFSNNFQILTQHMQNISEPERIHKIFLETVRFYWLAQASRSVSSMWWKSLLWTIICCFLSHSATSVSARNLCFSKHSKSLFILFCLAQQCSFSQEKKKAIALKTHGLVTATAQQCGDREPPSTRVSWCHCQWHDQALPLPFSSHQVHTATVRGYLSHNSSKL